MSDEKNTKVGTCDSCGLANLELWQMKDPTPNSYAAFWLCRKCVGKPKEENEPSATFLELQKQTELLEKIVKLLEPKKPKRRKKKNVTGRNDDNKSEEIGQKGV